MAVTSEKDLSEPHKASWLKAMSAMELRNYQYAIQLLQGILKAHPEFLLCRKLARKAAVTKCAGKKNLLGGISGASLSIIKIQSQMKRDALGAIEAIEKLLESDPYNAQVNQLLKEAALLANLPEVAEFALETIIEGNPKDTKTMHELAKMYMAHSKPEEAVEVYNRILKVAPNDLAAIKGSKDASAAASMLRGGWEREDTTYRELIKNKEQAIALEQQSRVFRSEEMIDSLLADLHAKVEADPQNLDTSRRIAELYEQKGDLENAIAWYDYAGQLSGNTDLSLARKASDLRLKQYDLAIQGYQDFIAQNPGTEEAEKYARELEELKAQRSKMLLDAARERVERNPTDLMLRYELGEILVSMGEYREAIAELQKARQNPSVRLKAMNLLGKCYTERGMLDLAADTLSAAAAEIVQMDNTKKAILYDLGIVYEKMGDHAKSIDCMKQIYAVDYGYRDVADRVEGSYAKS